MKKGMMLLVWFLLLAGLAQAADGQTVLDSATLAAAVKNYKFALKSENPGVRSSALYMLAQIKSRYPEANLGEFKSELGKLSRKDNDPLVRVHANLVLSYVSDDALAARIKPEGSEMQPAFYARLIETISNPDNE